MKKIVWCVPLSFVTAVIFLLVNASSAQAAMICGWTAISVGANEYIYTWSCYDNGGDEGREDNKYGTRPGSNNPREGGGGGGTGATKPDDKLVGELIVKLVTEYEPPCQASNERSDLYAVRAQASCIQYVTGGITRVFPALTGALPAAIIAGAANACRLKITVDLPTTGGPPICK